MRPIDDTDFIAGLQSLINNKEFSDVKFEIDGKNLYAHKAILAARSKYFSDMFRGKNQDLVRIKFLHNFLFSKIDLILSKSLGL